MAQRRPPVLNLPLQQPLRCNLRPDRLAVLLQDGARVLLKVASVELVPVAAHEALPDPKQLGAEPAADPKGPAPVQRHERLHDAPVPRVDVVADIENDFGVWIRRDEIEGECGSCMVGDGGAVANDLVKVGGRQGSGPKLVALQPELVPDDVVFWVDHSVKAVVGMMVAELKQCFS